MKTFVALEILNPGPTFRLLNGFWIKNFQDNGI